MQTPTIERARTRIPAATFARDLLGRDRALATVGVFLVTAGAAVWVTRSGLQLGGHRAVGLMATHINGRRAAARMADLDRQRSRHPGHVSAHKPGEPRPRGRQRHPQA